MCGWSFSWQCLVAGDVEWVESEVQSRNLNGGEDWEIRELEKV